MTFSALSGVIAAIGLSIKGKLNKKLAFMSYAILALGISVALLALAPFMAGPVVWLYMGMALIGFTNVGFNVPFSTLLQRIVKNEDLGKVSGIIDTFMTGASLLASVLAATLAKYISISLLLGIVASTILASGIIFVIVTRIRKMDQTALRREEEMMALEDIKERKIEKNKAVVSFETESKQEYSNLNPSLE